MKQSSVTKMKLVVKSNSPSRFVLTGHVTVTCANLPRVRDDTPPKSPDEIGEASLVTGEQLRSLPERGGVIWGAFLPGAVSGGRARGVGDC